MLNSIRILIASKRDEDQNRILDALSEKMEFSIIDIVRDETGAIIKSEYLKPHILILDLQLSGINDSEFVRSIRRRSPATAIIFLYDYIDNKFDLFADFAFIDEVSGLLLKESDIDKLAHIIKIVFLGGCYINASITVRIINSITLLKRYNIHSKSDIFTSAERSILTLLAHGMSDAQIADELNISTGSIRNCLTEVRQKTKMKSRVEIVIYSLVSGYIHVEKKSYK